MQKGRKTEREREGRANEIVVRQNATIRTRERVVRKRVQQ